MLRATDELEFLSDAALALSELGPDEDVFRFVAERLAIIAPDTLVVTASYDPDTERATIRAVVGPPQMQRQARAIIGEPEGQVLAIDRRAREILADGRLTRIEADLHPLAFHHWQQPVARRLAHELGLRSIYGQPFSRGGDFLGAVAFASRAPALAYARVIEVFVRQVAFAIRRRRAEARLRDSEQAFRMLAENSRDVVFRMRVRPTLAMEYVCPAVERLLGIPVDDVYQDAGLASPGLFPEAWLSDGVPATLPAEPVLARAQRRDGAAVWMEQNFTPIHDPAGELVVIEGMARDVTRRKQAEDAIVDADRRKTEFLAVLSHELRNPLGAIRNATYVLGVAGAHHDQGRRAIAVIDRQIVQLTRLVDDLLDLTRISRGKVHLQKEHLDLAATVRVLVDDYAAACERAGVVLDRHAVDGDVIVFGDGARIAQILDNLLNNAVKFTPAGGRIVVHLGVDAATQEAVLRVRNTGSWIPPELQANVFVPFVQAEHTLDRSKGGLGLGLALVKGLVELHGGAVAVASAPEAGTTFEVRLPLAGSRAATAPHVATLGRPSGPPRRVLVIEDNEDAAETIRVVLELEGHVVAIARTGRDGIELAREFRPDLVVCDIGLPEMTGYDVARAFRADPALHGVPLIALTGYAGPDDVLRSREAGFDRHFSKPLALPALERAIAELTAPTTIATAAGSRETPSPP